MAKIGIAGENLTGKVVIVRKSFFRREFAEGDRIFKCESGFGCDPDSAGTKVFGTFLSDGEKTWIRRSDVEQVVDE